MKTIEVGKPTSRCARGTLVELDAEDFEKVIDAKDLLGIVGTFATYTCPCCKSECRVPWEMIPKMTQDAVTARLGKKVAK